MTGIGGHQQPVMKNDEWLTPPEIVGVLGPTATRQLTKFDDGLAQPWHGRVWMNPPYGRDVDQWMRKLAEHGNGVALIFARTETAAFFPWVWDHAHAILFIKGRLHFHYVHGGRAAANSGAPSVLIAYGANNVECLTRIEGKLLTLRC